MLNSWANEAVVRDMLIIHGYYIIKDFISAVDMYSGDYNNCVNENLRNILFRI